MKTRVNRPIPPVVQKLRLAALSETVELFKLVRRLVSLAKGHFWFFPGMVALAVLASIFEGLSLALIIPLVQLLETGNGMPVQGPFLRLLVGFTDVIPVQSQVLAIVIAILAAVIIKNIISYSNMTLLGIVYGRLSHAIRTGIFTKIVETPLAQFESDRSGRLLNILNNESWRATDALRYLFNIVISLAAVLVFGTILIVLSWRMSLLALALIATIFPCVRWIGARAKIIGKQGLAENEILAKRTWTALSGMRMIHAFGSEKYETERFAQSSDRVRRQFLKMALYTMTTGPITEIAITAIIALLLLVIAGQGASIGAFAGFLAILYRLQPRVLALASAHTNLLALHAYVVAVSDILEAQQEPLSTPGHRFNGLRKSLAFENVTFTYKGALEPALFDVSFQIPKGTTVAIVGASGAGKSTLIDLLLRFQLPQQGRILVDDIALQELAVPSWRAAIGVVNQDPYIFDDTVAANLGYGSPATSRADIVEAARVACADEFIRALPDGYDTVVGERGTQLSGGQRQRIALARALLRQPEILILDEATNALDATTERAFQRALEAYVQERTLIVVAHRLATIENADHVIVLEAGRITEQGSPAALLKAGRRFTRNFVVDDCTLESSLPRRAELP